MLKVIRNLTSWSNTLETLDVVGTIELLVDFLITNSKSEHYKVIPPPGFHTSNGRKSSIRF